MTGRRGRGTLVAAVGVGVLLEPRVVLLHHAARLGAVVEDMEREQLAQLVGVGRLSAAVVEVQVGVEDGEQPSLQRGEQRLLLVILGRCCSPVLEEAWLHAQILLDIFLGT
jgi:hypothetical protein